MCGIVGYIGNKSADAVLLDGLKRLEYRGYDSAGVAVAHEGEISVRRAAGKVVELENALKEAPVSGNVGIAHTRWATHGEPTEANAHPHRDCKNELAVVHNGIIENYASIKEKLQAAGHEFRSETDTEVLAHAIEEERTGGASMEDAILNTLATVRGTFGIAVLANNENKIIAARRGSPLCIGIGENETVIASDPSALVRLTRDVIFLDDDELAVITPGNVDVRGLDKSARQKDVTTIEWDVEDVSKGGYDHFMIKEISEQDAALRDTMRGRVTLSDELIKLGGLSDVADQLRDKERVIIVSCGSSYYAGMIGSYILEDVAGISSRVEWASEFRYRNPFLDPKKDVLLAISQSGETADTLAAIHEAKNKGVMTLGIVNAVGSTIARDTDAGVYNHVGPEIAVATTKAFLSQVTILTMLSILLGRQRRLSPAEGEKLSRGLVELPALISNMIDRREQIREVAEKYKDASSMLYVGRNVHTPVAYEGALKLKEIAYIHAEGYGAGEMKHGPIALLEPSFPVMAIAPNDGVFEKMKSNIEEMKARRAPIIALTTDGTTDLDNLADDILYTPKTIDVLQPIISTVALQLFSYYIATARGLDPDKPRNLAKSVTVE